MGFVDLHVHTINSDGHDSPSAVVAMAAEHGVTVLGVADHDNLRGLGEAIEVGKKLGVKVATGVEISTIFHGHTIHILGYNIPLGNSGFHSFLGELFAYRRYSIVRKIEKISDSFKAEGKKPVNLGDFINHQGAFFNREKAAEYLVINGFLPDQEEAFQMIAKTKTELECPATAERAVEEIHKVGGLAIVAHPFAKGTSLRRIDPTPEGQEVLLKELVAAGIDGIECYQSEYGPEETALALSLAEKYGLLVSAGSDWHGALCDVGEMKDRKCYYPEHIGGLGVTTDQVAPLLEKLGFAVDKRPGMAHNQHSKTA